MSSPIRQISVHFSFNASEGSPMPIPCTGVLLFFPPNNFGAIKQCTSFTIPARSALSFSVPPPSLEDCLSMVLELEDNSQNENLKQEQMNIIQQALEQLSPQRRKVFEMKVSGKYSNQEIADKLNLSINTIKFQYSQSLKQIRATVGELSLLLLYCMM